MNKVYDKKLLGDILEVYMDDMIVKSQQEVDHSAHLKRLFEQNQEIQHATQPREMHFRSSSGQIPRLLLNRKRNVSESR